MKGQLSRDSHRPAARFSGVYHVQGAMITDADLDERSDIVRARTDALGLDTVGDGVPRDGGAFDVDGLALRQGTVYADGVRGTLAAAEGTEPAGPLDLFTMQADLPEGPNLPSGARIVYADIWARPVFALEDPYLADPGLHGAETAFRSRTMCQLKSAPADAAGDIEAGSGRYVRIGDAVLAVEPRDPETTIDECDPCADVVSVEQRIANALFRLEVVRVDGPADAPTRVDLAWSGENGAIIAPSDIDSEAFERAGAVYELFSAATESHMGAFANSASVRNSVFADDMDAPPVTGTTIPFIRRWDGYARLNVGAGTLQTTLGAGFEVTYDGAAVALSVDAFTATLTLGGHAVLRGDYWLVELRTFAAADARVRLVSATPVGIEHHYCTLFRTNGGAVQPLTDAERRKLSFPALSDLPASHVGFDNTCPKLYADAANVQAALDNLCGISADDIGFDPSNCPTLFDSATTVQDALDNLCRVDFSIENVLRLLFDWGVVCGLVARLAKTGQPVVEVTPGWFLDRAGRLAFFKGGAIDVNALMERLSDEERQLAVLRLREGALCLTVATDAAREVSLHLVPKERAFGPADPGVLEVVRACIEGKGRIRIGDRFRELSERERPVVGRLALVAAQPSTLGGAQRMSQGDARLARGFSDAMADEFRRLASEDEVAGLDAALAAADAEFERDDSVGETREIRQMQYQATRLRIVLASDQDRARRCLCEGLFPRCPPELGEPPFHVPVACLQGFVDGGVGLTLVCMYSCRKQAMTWRSANYIFKDWRERLAGNLAETCCAPDDDGGGRVVDDFVYDPGLETANLAELARRYRVAEGLLGDAVGPQGLFETQPKVEGLTIAAAREVMTGNGADVAGTVDISDAKAFELIEEQAAGITPIDQIGDTGRVRPGDKVMLLTQDGVARGYVVVERGGGKYIFPPEGRAVLSPERARRIEELATRLRSVTDAEVRIESEIDRLAGVRDGLSGDVTRLGSEIDALTAARARAQSELDALTEAQRATVAELAAARRELEAAGAQRNEFVMTIRRNQPIASLGLERELLARLAEGGVVTLADVDDRTLARLVNARVIDREQAANIAERTKAFLDREIR